jgi:hypothetical protein
LAANGAVAALLLAALAAGAAAQVRSAAARRCTQRTLTCVCVFRPVCGGIHGIVVYSIPCATLHHPCPCCQECKLAPPGDNYLGADLRWPTELHTGVPAAEDCCQLCSVRCAELCCAWLCCAVPGRLPCCSLLPLSGRHARWKIRQLAGNCCRCQPTCMLQETPGCGAFTWNPTQGGSCYLKAPSGWTVTQPGDASQSGVLVPAASEAAQEPSQPTQKPATNAGTPPPAGVRTPCPAKSGEASVPLPHLLVLPWPWALCRPPASCCNECRVQCFDQMGTRVPFTSLSRLHSTPRLHCTALHCRQV